MVEGTRHYTPGPRWGRGGCSSQTPVLISSFSTAKMKEKEKKVELWKVQRRREERELELAARADELDRVRNEI